MLNTLPPEAVYQKTVPICKLRVEFLLKTDSGYPKDTGVNKPWQPLGIPSAKIWFCTKMFLTI